MKKLRLALLVSGLSAVVALGSFWTTAAHANGGHHNYDMFVLDVAVNGNLSLFTGSTDERGTFVVYARGNIYPRGTLPHGTDEPRFDPDTDGALGTWRCHFLGMGDRDFPPLTAMVTYIFQFEKHYYHSGYHGKESTIVVRGLNAHFYEDTAPRVFAIVLSLIHI